MEEAHALLARLERIEALDRADAPPELLLPELQALVHEAEAWARREHDPAAEAAAAACATACGPILGAAILGEARVPA